MTAGRVLVIGAAVWYGVILVSWAALGLPHPALWLGLTTMVVLYWSALWWWSKR